MTARDDTLDIFLQKLDAINSFCESRGDESQHACAYAPPRITMELIEYPTSNGRYHIISERDAVIADKLTEEKNEHKR